MKNHPLLLLGALFFVSCAQLHHVQLADIDNRSPKGRSFSVKVSETGINIQEAARIGKAFAKNKESAKQIDTIQQIISAFQMGPVTGNHVFSETYAENLLELLLEECPSGRITDLVSIRENRKYPVISGEIVKINGTCLQ